VPLIIELHETLAADFARYAGDLGRAVSAALGEEGEKTMTESKQECPVDTGELRASGHVDGPHDEGGVITLELNYGGAAAPYAIYVHERMDVHHPVGKAKFLEDPAMRMSERLPAAIAARAGA
jgi:hypothetical protein